MKKWKKMLALILFFSCIVLNVCYAKESTASTMYQNVEKSILKSKNVSSVQQYIDKCLVPMAGKGAEWYIILFYKLYGDALDYKKYKVALDEYVTNSKKMSKTINKTSMQLIALSYLCVDNTNAYLTNVCDETIGEQGIMSLIYGLHLLNNNLPSSKWTKDMVIDKLISICDKNKGYSFMGNDTDIDVTSMVVQALAPYYNDNVKVKETIDNCVNIISSKQLADGTFLNSGLINSESISQVILMASTINIDIETDKRLIKNNIDLYMALSKFLTNDGLYSHILDNDSNTLATQQASYALGSMVLHETRNENLLKIR